MKLEALAKAVASAREQARLVGTKVRQLTQVAEAAKVKAKQAKSKLKLARQEAKRARRTAKDAKRTLAEAVAASEVAASEVARLENKLEKAGKKAQQFRPERKRPKRVVQVKTAAPKSQLRSQKEGPPKSPPKLAVQARRLPAPVLKVPQPAKPQREGGSQVPRDSDAKPNAAASLNLHENEASSALGR